MSHALPQYVQIPANILLHARQVALGLHDEYLMSKELPAEYHIDFEEFFELVTMFSAALDPSYAPDARMALITVGQDLIRELVELHYLYHNYPALTPRPSDPEFCFRFYARLHLLLKLTWRKNLEVPDPATLYSRG